MVGKGELPTHSAFFVRVGLPLARVLCGLLFLVLGPLRVRGRYRVPKEGGLLVLANHLSDIDPVACQLACPRPIYFMGKSELFEMPVLRTLTRWFKAFPVRRGEADRTALRTAVGYLQSGNVVLVYPEGQLSETGDLQELKPGVGLIAKMAGVPVLCLGLRGTNRVIPYGSYVPRPAFGGVEAVWGEPRQFRKEASVEEILDWVQGQLRELTDAPQ